MPMGKGYASTGVDKRKMKKSKGKAMKEGPKRKAPPKSKSRMGKMGY